MQRIGEETISANEKGFIQQAIRDELRVDGRGPYTHRAILIELSTDDSSATVQLGETRVFTVITADLEAPYPDRQREGSIRFSVELSPMASPAIEPGRPGEVGIELARLLERGIKQSGSVDVEALCVAPGRKVWALRVTTHVVNHAGNLLDACLLSATAALAGFRLPVVTIDHTGAGGGEGGAIVVHDPDVREPQPLSIHHLVFPATFALFQEGAHVALDPNLAEEVAADGSLSLMMTPRQELCGVQKAEGCGLDHHQLMRCVRLAASAVQHLSTQLQDALKVHAQRRVAERVRRRQPTAASGPLSSGAGVVVLSDMGAADVRLQALLDEIQEVAARKAEATQQQQQQAGTGDEDVQAAGDSGALQQQQQQPAGEGGSGQQQQRQGVKRPASAADGRPGPRLVGSGQAAAAAVAGGSAGDKGLEEIFDGLTTSAPHGSNSSKKAAGGTSRHRVGASAAAPLDQVGEISQIIAGGAAAAQATELQAAIKAGKKSRRN